MSHAAIAIPSAPSGDVRVGAFMTRDVATLNRNDTLEVAADLMAARRIRHLPVVESGAVVGVLSERDLLRPGLSIVLGYGTRARRMLLRSLVVKELMSEPPIIVSPDASARDAARLMLAHRIGCLPVVAGGALLGLVTESDLLRRAYGP
jgi:CBS domain-containing protein